MPPIVYSPEVIRIRDSFGGANFADILNRLWMDGSKVADLQKALGTTTGQHDNPEEVIKRLLDLKIVTPEQFSSAVNSYVPPDAQNAHWPFRPENTNEKGVHVPLFGDDSTKFYPDAPRPTLPIGTGATAGQAAKALTNVAGGSTPKPHKRPSTPEEIRKFEEENFSNMMWVKNIPELATILDEAAKGEYTPARFQARIESSEWWKNNKDTAREFVRRQTTDPETLKEEIKDKTDWAVDLATNLGIPFGATELGPLATEAVRLGWNDTDFKKAIMAKVQYDPKQAGGLGAFQTQAKSLGKNYLVKVDDVEAFDWAKKLATGEFTQENLTETLASRAKGSFPTIADFIENGGVPRDYFANHINSAAQLLEVDPETIDLTDPKYHDITSYADSQGKVRPMTLSETTSFVKQKDEYWKTGNSSNDVSSIINNLGEMFGRSAV